MCLAEAYTKQATIFLRSMLWQIDIDCPFLGKQCLPEVRQFSLLIRLSSFLLESNRAIAGVAPVSPQAVSCYPRFRISAHAIENPMQFKRSFIFFHKNTQSGFFEIVRFRTTGVACPEPVSGMVMGEECLFAITSRSQEKSESVASTHAMRCETCATSRQGRLDNWVIVSINSINESKPTNAMGWMISKPMTS